jgi:hypothetical protein
MENDQNFEELIWDCITNSAKVKFDFSAFEKEFEGINENTASNILFRIIVGYASGESTEILSIKLRNEMLLNGYSLSLDEIDKFLMGKDQTLKLEIYATELASKMLQEGIDELTVLNSTIQLLG